MLHSVKIKDIENEPNKILKRDFKFEIEELSASVESSLVFKSLGEFIDVKGNVKGKIDLECDVCLSPFVQDLDIEIEETFAKQSLQDEYSQEFELQRGQFITDLNGEKEIDIYDVLYQSVILALPNKKVCGINCNEDMFMSDENYHEHDSRMDIFKNIQIERKD